MEKFSFKDWLIQEKTDIFGFEKRVVEVPEKNDLPVNPINYEVILDSLAKLSVGDRKATTTMYSEIQWGDNYTGTVKLEFSPAGSSKAVIRKKSFDLEGKSVWVCKKVISLPDHRSFEEEIESKITQELLTEVNKTYKDKQDSPSKEYTNLENLTFAVIRESKLGIPKILIYSGIKKVDENHYMINFEYRGSGVEAPGARRVEQFTINMLYLPNKGIIRSWGHEISSPKRQHLWEIQPSEWDEFFMPTQSISEVVSAISTAFSVY